MKKADATIRIEDNKALHDIRHSFWSAMQLGERLDAKVALSLALSSFNTFGKKQRNVRMQRFFDRDRPVNLNDIVIYFKDERKRLSKSLGRRNWSPRSKVVRRARVIKVSKDRKRVTCVFHEMVGSDVEKKTEQVCGVKYSLVMELFVC